ncbi:WD40 repeat domain-containing protein, partial [Haliangium sp. UPWRP_2]|uniref:WD40 repeat domain-containing protein n=1 Tax=Haliangium sp. UPWRP_2 TaxID=1931276 RepID=UPI0011B254F1
DGTARLWDAKSGSPLATLKGHTNWVLAASFSPDGTRVVTASDDGTARLWDAKSGSPIATLKGHTSPVQAASFSPDGARVVTASSDGTARLWDATSGAALGTFADHQGAVYSAAFSPDGTLCGRQPRKGMRAEANSRGRQRVWGFVGRWPGDTHPS